MVISRVDSIWTGPEIRGGGITQHYFGVGSTSNQACVTAIENFWNSFEQHWHTGNNVTVEPTVTIINEITGDLQGQEVVTSAGPIFGTAAGDALPPATQGLVRWLTGQVANNRLIRGRTFLPGMVEANNDAAGRPSTAVQTTINAAALALIASATTELVIWHRPVGGANGAVGVVQTANMWTEWAQLRSRRD